MASAKSPQKYVPGVCNIGQSEITQRTRAGVVGLITSAVLWGGLIYLDAPQALRLVVALPATIATVGFIQAYLHFCVAFGAAGVFNIDKEAGKTDTVQQAEYRQADRKKAIQILVASVAVGLLTGLVAFYLG